MMQNPHTQRYRKLWESYHKMKQKCFDTNDGKFNGTVSDGWRSFYVFYEDMVETWFPNAVLEKIDPNKPYSPDNCDWVKLKNEEMLCL